MRRAALALAVALFPAAALADVGQAIAVVQYTVITASGQRQVLNRGDPVAEGDWVQTGPSGEAQILFPDQTRIAVGPGSTLLIDRALFRSDSQAERLAVSVIGGSFRFISGASRKRAYSIRTPVATLGVRGTAFDLSVPGPDVTDLIVFDGRVRFCGWEGPCASVPSGCTAVRVDRSSTFSQPRTPAEKAALIARNFPFVTGQQRLEPAFRTDTEGCGEARRIALPRATAPQDDDDDDDSRDDRGGGSRGNSGGGSGGDPGGGSGGGSGNPAE